jgi:DNA primase
MAPATLEARKRQILDRLDIVQVVSEHVALKRNGRRWVGLCCFHSEKTPSLSVSPDLGIFKCFGCGKAGDIFSFVQYRENISFREAFELLADRAGVSLDDLKTPTSATGEFSRNHLAAVNAWAAEFFRSCLRNDLIGRAAREYVVRRGIAPEIADAFEIGLAPDSGAPIVAAAAKAGFGVPLLVSADLCRKGDDGKTYETFRNRLMFPIRDATGRVVGFGGRTLGDHPAKYINTRQTSLFDKGKGLYGLNLAREVIGKAGRAIIVEGYTDCIACHQFGFAETVATLGTALTGEQVGLLRRFTDDVTLLFDSDQAGLAAAERAISVALPHGLRVRLAVVPDGKDPSDFLTRHGPDALRPVLNDAVEALEFKWLETCRRLDADSSNARRREAVVEFLGVVAAAQQGGAVDAVQRGLLVNQIAHLTGTESAAVRRLLQKFSSKSASRSSGTSDGGKSAETRDIQTVRSGTQRAWDQFLGALLNEPGAWRPGDAYPPLETIDDEQGRRLADHVRAALEERGDFSFADVLAICHDPADVARLSDIVEQGRVRGNHAETIFAAMEKIRRCAAMAAVESNRQLLRDSSAEDEQVRFSAVSDGLRNHRHFAPRRMIRLVVNDLKSGVTPQRKPSDTQ